MTEKVFLRAEGKLDSPLSVSNGEKENSDADITRDFDGQPFIPGTSIVGALRGYLEEKEANALFGYGEGETVHQSPVTVYDAAITGENTRVGLRDGISLSEERIAEDTAKFDYEIVENGDVAFCFEFYDENGREEDRLIPLLSAVNRGEIRFGHKKNRGNGRIHFSKILKKSYRYSEPFYEFDWDTFDWNAADVKSIKLPVFQKEKEHYRILRVPLRLASGISIRRYSALMNREDYATVTRRNDEGEDVPVIPGTSWNGALRHRAKRILKELGVQNADNVVDSIFGGKKGNISASKVVIGESVLKDSESVPMMRNRINRFDNATMNRALYTEVSCFGGNCVLEIMIKQDENTDWIAGLFDLVLKDLNYGFLAVGGQISIGRGIFSFDRYENDREQKELSALKEKLQVLTGRH